MITTFTLCLLASTVSAADENGLGFLVMGDWGGQDDAPYTEAGQAASAVAMRGVASNISASFGVGLGDNFYGSGIHSDEHDARFQETFENVYTGASLDIPFYMIAGNHDHKGNVTAQIAYTGDSTRWKYPSAYFNVKKNFTTSSGKQSSFELLLVDTVVWSGNSDDLSEANGRASKFDPLPGAAPHHLQLKDDQLEWVKATLKASTAEHLWVGGHYPIYSPGTHGPTQDLIDDLLPLLKQYGAHYMSGHDHMLWHISDGGVEHVGSGAGDNCCYAQYHTSDCPKGSIKFVTSSGQLLGGFASFQIDDDGAVVKYYDEKGNVLFTPPTIPPRKTV